MNYKIEEAVEILERTPLVLKVFISGLSDGWLRSDEGEGTWNAAEVIDHLIEAERNNWIPRLEHILQEGESKPFPAFDRFSHLDKPGERNVVQSLLEFERIRHENLKKLKALIQSDTQLEATGSHPAFGVVKVRELLSTWTVHDLTHMAQIVRVMAKRYEADVGPWIEYLGILNRSSG